MRATVQFPKKQKSMCGNSTWVRDDYGCVARSFLIPLLVAVSVALVGCSSSTDDPTAGFSAQQIEGREIAQSRGCHSCHGDRGQGGVGPAWQGLAGSVIELDDGSEVVADTEYLRRAIVDPAADIRAGYNIKMPFAEFEADEVNAMITYIEGLQE